MEPYDKCDGEDLLDRENDPPERRPVQHAFEAKQSAQISWARYDHETEVLEIDFKDKHGNKASTYAYDGFPWHEWQRFEQAESKGKHFAYVIRPGWKGRRLP